MVERVAKALHEQDRDGFGALEWEILDEAERRWYFDCARAAIEAMRATTSAMVKAGASAIDESLHEETESHCWQAMIDAALGEP
jgi:hypothetical protein